MCSRGIFQLRTLKIQYCDMGGSSKGIRELLTTDILDRFAKENPHLKLEVYQIRGEHPYIRTEYLNGWSAALSLRNLNSEETWEAIKTVRNKGGHSALKHSGPKVFSSNKSIQGGWRPNLWGTELSYTDSQPEVLPSPPTPEMRHRKPPKPQSRYDEVDKTVKKEFRFL